MKKRLLGMILTAVLAMTMLVGCGANGSTSTDAESQETEEKKEETDMAEPAEEETDGKIGVAMPTKDLQRWNQDGSNMEAELIKAG